MTLRSNSRKQFDYSRPLLKENSLEAFLRLDGTETTETSFPEGGKVGNLRSKTSLPETAKKTETPAAGADPQKNKSNIAIPSVNKLGTDGKDAENNLKKFQTEENYLRYTYVKLYPHPEVYEASDYDLEFLKELNLNSSGKLKTGSEQITREDFERMIEIWDAETDKDEPISLQKAQSSIEKVFDVATFKDQISEIYIYWKGRREALKRPLVRKYWRTVNRDEMNPNIVFRAREKQKIETRRHKKGNTVENLEKMKGLKNELEMARTLLANLSLREMIKAELNGLSISKFDMTAQEKIEGGSSGINLNNYKEKFENEERLHKRNQLKEFNKVAKQFIDQPKEEPDNPLLSKIPQALGNLVIRNINRAEENNFLLARFISNIAMRTDQKNITMEKVEKLDLPSFQQSSSIMTTPIIMPQPNPILEQKKSQQVIQEVPQDRGAPDTVIRTTGYIKPDIKPILEPVPVAQPKNIFRYKIRRRFGRQGRQYIDKIYVPPEDAHFELYKERVYEIVPPRKLVKLDTFERGPLNALYEKKYSKVEDMYPFADSDDDKDLAEFSKSLKKTMYQFKNFQKQRRSSTLFTE